MNTKVFEKIKLNQATLKSWMDHMHQSPELAMTEKETAKFIATKLREIGEWEIVEGVGGTGIVASMSLGNSTKTIALRADFDALPIVEDNDLSYKSKVEVEIIGKGSHGSMPELGIDPIVCGSSLVMALQTIISRNLSPWHSSVVNVGSFQSETAGNVVPQNAILRLSIRNMDSDDRKAVLDKIRTMTKAQAESFNCNYEIREGIPGTVLVNSDRETKWASEVAKRTFGKENVFTKAQPYMGSEDFAFMLEKRPGNYVMIGNGDTYMVHHPKYIFNQELLPLGASYWVALVEEYLKTD